MYERRPMAFLSYAHFADSFDGGYLTKFSLRLSGEACLQWGDQFPIFQDRKDLLWGDCWKERINSSLDTTTFLIPVITPGFFKSEYCREELSRFLERESRLGRDDLVLPVYYIDTPALNDKKLQENDELVRIIASRQYADWRDLRFEDLDSKDARKAISNLAAQICKALYRLDNIQNTETDSNPSIKSPIESPGDGRDSTGPKEMVVDKRHRGDYKTINAAIAAATPGSRISIKPGTYSEGLVIDKPLEIVGDGEIDEVVIGTLGKTVITFKTMSGKISNISIRQNGLGNFNGVDITQGCLELENCDIVSKSADCIAIHGNAYPKIRHNKIHGGKDSGIFIFGNGQGLIENNQIFGNLDGIWISGCFNLSIKGNYINNNVGYAVLMMKNPAQL